MGKAAAVDERDRETDRVSAKVIEKRGYHGAFHHISPKYLHRHVNEFATCHNMRPKDTEAMMAETVARMTGKRLTYAALIAD